MPNCRQGRKRPATRDDPDEGKTAQTEAPAPQREAPAAQREVPERVNLGGMGGGCSLPGSI